MSIVIQIEGAFGESNFGDDLLLFATLNMIKQVWNDGFFLVNARDNSVSGDYLDMFPGVDGVARGIDRYLVRPDILIYAGGTQFYSYPKIADSVQHDTTGILYRLVRKFGKVLRRPKKVAFLGIGIGPFLDGNELASRNVIDKNSFKSVRDINSVGYLNKWGIRDYVVGSDICFIRKSWIEEFSVHYKSANSGVENIGIVVRDFNYDLPGRTYLSGLLEFAERVSNENISVVFFAFSKLKDKNCIDLLQKKGLHVHVWDGNMNEFRGYLEKISSCDFLISARYHGVVFAAMLGLPSIGVALDPKISMLCNELGLGAGLWSDPFDVSALYTSFHEICARYESARVSLNVNTELLEQRSISMFSEFVRFTSAN